MPPKVPPTPYNLVVPLRRDNEAPQCPEVKRCLLSVEREPLPDLLEVVDSGLPSQALNRDTSVQVVRAQLIPSGHSCRKDYTVKAGLFSKLGPIAVGKDSAGLWEVLMDGCSSRPPVLREAPVHLMCRRYRVGSIVASISVYQAESGQWHIEVDRRGDAVMTAPFLAAFSPGSDVLHVSAAMSRDLRKIYIVESRKIEGSPGFTGMWHYYGFDPYSAVYVHLGSGPVPIDPQEGGVHYVDRDGWVEGPYAYVNHIVQESGAEGGVCSSFWHGSAWETHYNHFDRIDAWRYSIPSGALQNGSEWTIGRTVSHGEDVTVRRTSVSGMTDIAYRYRREHRHPGGAGFSEASWSRNAPIRWALNIGDDQVGTNNPDGEIVVFSGRLDDLFEQFGPTNTQFRYSWSESLYLEYFSGVELSAVTPGGWVHTLKSGHTKTLNYTGGHDVWEGDNTDYFHWYCPNFAAEYENCTDHSVSTRVINHPVPMSVADIHRSFIAADEESGDSWMGIYASDSHDGEPSWHIYHNFAPANAIVQACTGRSGQDISAIYWRAV